MVRKPEQFHTLGLETLSEFVMVELCHGVVCGWFGWIQDSLGSGCTRSGHGEGKGKQIFRFYVFREKPSFCKLIQ